MATGALLFMRSMPRLIQAWYRRTCPTSPSTRFSPQLLWPSSSAFLRRLFSIHTSLFCWVWVVNMKSETVHPNGWQPVRHSERDTQQDRAGANLVYNYSSQSLIHYSLHDTQWTTWNVSKKEEKVQHQVSQVLLICLPTKLSLTCNNEAWPNCTDWILSYRKHH